MTRQEIREALEGRPDARLRASQIARWVYLDQADAFERMTDLPTSLRAELAERFILDPLIVARRHQSGDGVEKLLVHSGDGQCFECVLLPFESRVSCCLSSQVGCPMGCLFCATGLGGFDRNLTAAEIVGQYLALQKLSPKRIGHVVFMGMGEPLLNLPNVLKAMKLLHDESGISYRRMTLSTVGIVPKIAELAALGLPIHLALSLHSPFDRVRDTLMPVNRRWRVAEVMAAMRDYQRATGRKLTIEYLLIEGVTDTLDQAAELARLVRGVPSLVNLIPFNFVPTEQRFKRPSSARVRAFRAALASRGVNVTQRVERGHDIMAACGQLAGEHAGKLARGSKRSELLALA